MGTMLALVTLAACGGKAVRPAGSADPSSAANLPDSVSDDPSMGPGMNLKQRLPLDTASIFGPLEVATDWKTYHPLNSAAFPSPTHGGRMVNVLVNDTGVDAYRSGAPMPVGSVVVKTSLDPSGVDGPMFIMEKRGPDFNPDEGNWWYAIYWPDPPPAWAEKTGGPVYWRTPSAKAAYCYECHQAFDRELGGVPDDVRNW